MSVIITIELSDHSADEFIGAFRMEKELEPSESSGMTVQEMYQEKAKELIRRWVKAKAETYHSLTSMDEQLTDLANAYAEPI
jgi:hypothetical protein